MTSHVRHAGRRDYDSYSDDGRYLGSAKNPAAAAAKADAHRLELLRRGLNVDPLDLYAGTPQPATACNVEALGRAYSHFLARHAERMERSGRVLSKGDRDLITRSITDALRLVQQRAWRVREDGTLEIEGDRTIVYLVDDEGCFDRDHVLDTGERAQCKSQQYWRKRHGGECKHTVARELIRLAQLFASDAITPLVTERLVKAEIAGKLLGHTFAIIAAAEDAAPVTIQITERRLRVAAGEAPSFTHGVALQATTVGAAKVELEASTFHALWSQFRPIAATIPQIELRVDLESGLLALVAPDGSVVVSVQGAIL